MKITLNENLVDEFYFNLLGWKYKLGLIAQLCIVVIHNDTWENENNTENLLALITLDSLEEKGIVEKEELLVYDKKLDAEVYKWHYTLTKIGEEIYKQIQNV